MKKLFYLCIAAAMAGAIGTVSAKKGDGIPKTKDMVLMFNSGFEAGTTGTENNEGSDKLSGIDNSVNGPNDWTKFRDGLYPGLGKFTISYEGGYANERYARIVDDPASPGNKVLTYKIIDPNVRDKKGVAYKSRIQASIGNCGMHDIYQSVRLYIHPDMEFLKTMPEKIGHLILMEWWNNSPGRDKGYVSRVSLRLHKPDAKKPEMFIKVDSQNIGYSDDNSIKSRNPRSGAVFNERWSEVNRDFQIPYGKWMTVEYYLKEGDENTGRFYLAITPDGGKKQVIFDITGETYGHGNPILPGFKSWCPMKLYTSKKITEYMRDNNKSLQVYWDDLKIWTSRDTVQ